MYAFLSRECEVELLVVINWQIIFLISSQPQKKQGRFVRLQKLIADDNKLATDSVFVALAGLPR